MRLPLRAHFRGRAAALYPTFRAWAAAARSCGPVTIYAQKSRIVIQARVRFAGAMVRAGYLDATLWLRRRIEHPRLLRLESLGRLGYSAHFRLERPADVAAPLRRLMREAHGAAVAPPRPAKRSPAP